MQGSGFQGWRGKRHTQGCSLVGLLASVMTQTHKQTATGTTITSDGKCAEGSMTEHRGKKWRADSSGTVGKVRRENCLLAWNLNDWRGGGVKTREKTFPGRAKTQRKARAWRVSEIDDHTASEWRVGRAGGRWGSDQSPAAWGWCSVGWKALGGKRAWRGVLQFTFMRNHSNFSQKKGWQGAPGGASPPSYELLTQYCLQLRGNLVTLDGAQTSAWKGKSSWAHWEAKWTGSHPVPEQGAPPRRGRICVVRPAMDTSVTGPFSFCLGQ